MSARLPVPDEEPRIESTPCKTKLPERVVSVGSTQKAHASFGQPFFARQSVAWKPMTPNMT